MSLSAKVVAEPEQQTSNHHTLELATQRRVLVAYGQTIIYNRGGCAWLRPAMRNLLNINPAHREQVSTDGSETLQGLIIYISRMMDSATQYRDEWGR